MKTQEFLMDLRTKSVEELITLGEDRRAELFAIRFQAAVGSLEQTHKIKSLKKDIARIEMILSERKAKGENVNQAVKVDYNKAVESAEKAGKEVRAKQRELIEQMQSEQFGGQNQIGDDAIAQAMAAAAAEEGAKPEAEEVKAPKAETKAAPKAEAKPATAKKEAKPAAEKKPAAKKAETTKAEAKPAAKKPAAKKATEEVKPNTGAASAVVKELKAEAAEVKAEDKELAAAEKAAKLAAELEAAQKEVAKAHKAATKAHKEVEAAKVEVEAAKGTGKGKAKVAEPKAKTVKTGVAKGEDIEGIELNLSKKPKDAKTYVFGSNAEEAKKQVEEANKKAAEKKAAKKADDKKGAK